MIDIDKAIATAVKTGKVVFGAKEAMRSVKSGKARMIMIASNTLFSTKENLGHNGRLSEIPIVTYKGNNFDLGRICGKRFPVGTLTVKEPGDSAILKLIEEIEKEQALSKSDGGGPISG